MAKTYFLTDGKSISDLSELANNRDLGKIDYQLTI